MSRYNLLNCVLFSFNCQHCHVEWYICTLSIVLHMSYVVDPMHDNTHTHTTRPQPDHTHAQNTCKFLLAHPRQPVPSWRICQRCPSTTGWPSCAYICPYHLVATTVCATGGVSTHSHVAQNHRRWWKPGDSNISCKLWLENRRECFDVLVSHYNSAGDVQDRCGWSNRHMHPRSGCEPLCVWTSTTQKNQDKKFSTPWPSLREYLQISFQVLFDLFLQDLVRWFSFHQSSDVWVNASRFPEACSFSDSWQGFCVEFWIWVLVHRELSFPAIWERV